MLPFALVVYLALEGGGYDVVVRSEVGMALWWIVLLGALVGVLPVRPLGRAEQVGSLSCSPSRPGRPSGSPGRRAASEAWRRWAASSPSWAVLALSLSAQDREALRRTVRAVGSAIAVVGVLALLSRLEPSWFPETSWDPSCPPLRRGSPTRSTTGTGSPP